MFYFFETGYLRILHASEKSSDLPSCFERVIQNVKTFSSYMHSGFLITTSAHVFDVFHNTWRLVWILMKLLDIRIHKLEDSFSIIVMCCLMLDLWFLMAFLPLPLSDFLYYWCNAEKLRELAWSGVPPYLRPTVWRLLLVWPSSNWSFFLWWISWLHLVI